LNYWLTRKLKWGAGSNILLRGKGMKVITFFVRNRWLFLFLLLLIVLVVGIWAWDEYHAKRGIEAGFFDNFYAAIQTPVANATFPVDKQSRTPIPVSLEILRIAGPLIIVFGIFALLEEFGAVFSREVKYLFLFFFRKPTLFFGLDSNVDLLVRELQAENKKTGYFKKRKCAVFLEKTQTNSFLPDKNILIIRENFGDLRFLKRIRFGKTQDIFIHLGDDATNMSLASHIEELCPQVKRKRNPKNSEIEKNIRNSRKTRVLVHLSKRENSQWFKEIKGEDSSKCLDLRAINFHSIHASFFVDQIATEQLIEQYLLVNNPTADSRDLPIVLAGLTDFGGQVLLEIAAMFHFIGISNKRVVILDDNADEKVRSFLRKYPDFCLLSDICLYPLEKIDFMSLDTAFKNEEERKEKYSLKKENHLILDRAFLVITAFDTVLENLQTCRELRNYYLRLRKVINDPLIFYFSQENRDTIFPLLNRDVGVERYERSLEIRGFDRSDVLSIRQLFENIEKNDELAKANHNSYFDDPLTKDKLDIEWSKLSDYFKEENRYKARHLHYSLKQRGYEVVDQDDEEVEKSSDPFDDCVLKIEHNRWVAKKMLNGYRYAEKQDEIRKRTISSSGQKPSESAKSSKWKELRDIVKVHNDLVSFEVLPEKEQRKDDVTFKNTRKLLQSIGKKAVKKHN